MNDLLSRVKILAPLQLRGFRTLWAGMTISLIGDGVTLVAIAWQVYELSNVPTALGITMMAMSIPQILLLLFGGFVSDRFERRRVMLFADLVRGAADVTGADLETNPDIEIHRTLTRVGSDHVAALFGWVDASTADGPIQLAMLQQFLRTASDGWELALASVRNLFAEADLHADEVGGDFAGEAARLGTAVAEVHQTLRETMPTGVLDAAATAEAMRVRLDAALVVVPDLAEHARRLRATYDALAALPDSPIQQIHGDLHLGQTLRTVKGWKLVDFEGEPARPLAERMSPDSPWRDVAGMLRSFDYAPRVTERTFADADPDEEAQRHFRADEWAARNQAAFLDAYAGRELSADEETLLAAYLADKVVYEAVYETRNRSSWVSIPLEALSRWGVA